MKAVKYLVLLFIMCSSLSAQDNYTSYKYITLSGTAISSIGKFKDSWESGKGIYISYENIYSNNWALIFQGGYLDFKENSTYGFSQNPKFSVIPVQVGTRYYFNKEILKPFLLAMSGFNIVNEDYSVMGSSGENIKKTSVHFNFQIGLGIGIHLFDPINVELVGIYNSHQLDVAAQSNITGLEYCAGIKWSF
jgi:hypothetical protein